MEECLEAKTYTALSGCGELKIIINTNGKFQNIFLHGSMTKESPCGGAWLSAMSGILTFAIRRAEQEGDDAIYKGIIKQLKNHNCNCQSVSAKSCVHQISVVLERYFKERK